MNKKIISDFVAVTDHIKNFSVEKKILDGYFQDEITNQTTIILVWHKLINEISENINL